MLLIVLIVLGLIFVPTLAAAFFSLLFKLLCVVFKLAFNFWQATLFVIFIILIASLF